jgi:hypothetical protein
MSSRRLGDISFASLLPDSIRDDATIAAAAAALDGLLKKTTHAIPNLLIWARLDRENPRLIPPLARLVEASGGLKALSTELLELLAWQFHVDFREVALDDAMLERMVRESIPWHRIKGTPAAVEEALAMYGVEALTDESGTGDNWAVYELQLAEVPRGRALANILRVAEIAAAKRCQLRRVYGQFDRRPILLDRGPSLDEGFLDDDSGVFDPETGVKLSFGDTVGMSAEPLQRYAPFLSAEQLRPFRAFYVDKPILDQWRLDSPTVGSHGMIGSAVISLQSVGIQASQRWLWLGPWDRRRWNESGLFPGYAPVTPNRRITSHRSLSKAQHVLDFARLDSSLERLDRQVAVVVSKPQRLDFSRLDAGLEEMNVRRLYIDERFMATSPLSTASDRPDTSASVRHICGISAERDAAATGIGIITYKTETLGLMAMRRPYCRPDGTEWTGPWNHRTWRSMGVPVRITTIDEGE